MMRSSNPALSANVFLGMARSASGESMTLQGAVNKTLVLLMLLLISASYVWGKMVSPAAPMFGEVAPDPVAAVGPLMMLGLIGGTIVAFATIFVKKWAPITAPLYALLQGLAMGGISAVLERQFPGIVMQAVGLTFGTLFCMLMAYKSGLIQVTDKFRMGVVAATGAVMLIYVVNFVMSFFGSSIGMIHSSGMMGIGFSLVVVGIAALNLVMDFDFIERGADAGLPKYMEWYSAFGLMVTLVWLYLEMLRLLSKLNSRR